MASHFILDGRVRLYQRPESANWHCETRLGGRKLRKSTGQSDLGKAGKVAEDWYFTVRGGQTSAPAIQSSSTAGSPDASEGPTFADAAAVFEQEYVTLTEGQRNESYVRDHMARLANHLIPFFGREPIRSISAGRIQDYRLMRLKPRKDKPLPSASTLNHEIVTLRHVMKTALRRGWIDHLPDFSAPYAKSKKVSHRAWFSPEEYKQFYQATRARAKALQGTRHQYAAEQFHDYVLFMANTGLRPDEANRLEYRDVEIMRDEDTGEKIALVQVRGKRGVGLCKSMPGAVFPFQRLVARNQPQPTDLVFPQNHKKLFNRVLNDLGLKFDRDGNPRTSYSLRHTYICLRLLEGADIYQVAKNCRTSVEMIERHYAVHLKNTIDASVINVRRQRAVAPLDDDFAALNPHLTGQE